MAKVKLQYFLAEIALFMDSTSNVSSPPRKAHGNFLISDMFVLKTNYLGTLTLKGLQCSAISDDCLNSLTEPAANNKIFNKHRKLYQDSQFVQKRLS